MGGGEVFSSSRPMTSAFLLVCVRKGVGGGREGGGRSARRKGVCVGGGVGTEGGRPGGGGDVGIGGIGDG